VIKYPIIEKKAIEGRAGIGFRVFWERKIQILPKRPIVAKIATIREFKIPVGTIELTKIRGKTISPPPKIKNRPPIFTFSKET
jgi:hypothetical protein